MRVFGLKHPTGAVDAPPTTPVVQIDPAASTPPLVAWMNRAVTEAVSISALAVRMAVKNSLLISALRDDQAFDPRALARAAKQKYVALALESDETAARLANDPGTSCNCPACLAPEEEKRALRPEVHRYLAVALRDQLADRARIAVIIYQARRDAWSEVDKQTQTRLHSLGYAPMPDLVSGNAVLAAFLSFATRARHRHELKELGSMIGDQTGEEQRPLP